MVAKCEVTAIAYNSQVR